MAARSLDLIVNTQGNTLVSSFFSTSQASLPGFVFGDSTPVSVRLVTPSGIDARPWQEIDLSDLTVRIGVGIPGAPPTNGTFTLSYDGDTTTALPAGATPAQVSTSLNLLSSVISAGGVTATGNGSAYKIVFNTAGIREPITADTGSLSPTSGAFISEVLEGTAENKAIYLIKLETQPASYVELTDALPAASITISTIREGGAGISDIQSIRINPAPYDGTYTLKIGSEETASLRFDATASEIQTALTALTAVGANNTNVSGDFPNFNVTFASSLGNVDQMTSVASGLIVPTGKQGILDNNTTGVAELLASRQRVDATFEVEVTDADGKPWTPLQISCVLREDVIPNAPASQTGGPVYLLESVANDRFALISDTINSATLTLIADAANDVKGYPFVVVPAAAFQSAAALKGLSLGSSVEIIGQIAFLQCAGFRGDLVMPKSLKTVGLGAFEGTGFDGRLVLNEGLVTIEAGGFADMAFLDSDLVIPNTVVTIGNDCFFGSNFPKITIGSSVASIGSNAFEQTPATRIDSLAIVAPTLGAGAFTDIIATEIHVPANATGYGVTYGGLTVIYDL